MTHFFTATIDDSMMQIWMVCMIILMIITLISAYTEDKKRKRPENQVVVTVTFANLTKQTIHCDKWEVGSKTRELSKLCGLEIIGYMVRTSEDVVLK